MTRRGEDDGSVRWVLTGRQRRDAGTTGRALANAGVLGLVGVGIAGMSASARQFAQHEVTDAVDALLDIDAVEALATAWRTHRQLADARRRTQESGGRELVELARHQVSSVHPIHIDVVVDHVPRQRIDVSLSLGAGVGALVATVEGGRIAELSGGSTTVTAKLIVAGVVVLEGKRQVATAALLASRRRAA